MEEYQDMYDAYLRERRHGVYLIVALILSAIAACLTGWAIYEVIF